MTQPNPTSRPVPTVTAQPAATAATATTPPRRTSRRSASRWWILAGFLGALGLAALAILVTAAIGAGAWWLLNQPAVEVVAIPYLQPGDQSPVLTEPAPEAPAVIACGAPKDAVQLALGQTITVQPNRSAVGLGGVDYEDILPGKQMGFCTEGKTDFYPDNTWKPGGSYTWLAPAGAKSVWVAVEGDTPVTLTFKAGKLTATSNKSNGFSVVAYFER